MLIVVWISRYVITLGLSNKYDVVDHYSRFTAQILANPWNYTLYDMTLLFTADITLLLLHTAVVLYATI